MSAPRESSAPPQRRAAGVGQRIGAFLYEGVLLFGVLFLSGYLFATLTQQRHALQNRHGFELFLFLMLGIYFVWFWSRGGQTVAMKAWNLRLVARDGGPVSQPRALARYVLSWLWFAPTLLIFMNGVRHAAPFVLTLVANLLLYGAFIWTNRERQFFHDLVCGTRLVSVPPPSRRKSATAE